MAVRGKTGLGSSVRAAQRRTLSLHAEVAARLFNDPAEAPAALEDWRGVAAGSPHAGGGVATARTTVFGASAAPVSEPFLYVRCELPDGTTLHLGEVDRQTPGFQIKGDLVRVGDGPAVGFQDDYGVARARWSLAIADLGGTLGPYIKNGSWTRIRFFPFIGYPELTAAAWLPLAFSMRPDGPPETVSGVREFALIDSLEDYFGDTFPLPTLADVAEHGGRSGPLRYYDPSSVSVRNGQENLSRVDTWKTAMLKKRVPVAFGQEYAPLPFGWAVGGPVRMPLNQMIHGYAAIAVLGASKRRGWMESHRWGGDHAKYQEEDVEIWAFPGRTSKTTTRFKGDGLWLESVTEEDVYFQPYPVLKLDRQARAGVGEQVGWTYLSGQRISSGFELWVDVVEVPDPNETDPARATWFVAMLFAVLNGPQGDQTGVLLPAEERLLTALREAGEGGGILFVKTPYGAEGPAVPQALQNDGVNMEFPHDPPSIALEIVRRYGKIDAAGVDVQTFIDASTAAELNSRWTAGLVEEDTPVSDVLRDLCSTFRMDIYLSRTGFLRARPAGVTLRDLTERIPAAVELSDDLHLLTFSERPRIGDERWGMANRFKIEGLRKLCLDAFPYLRDEYTDPATATALNLGRTVLRTVNVGWTPQVRRGLPIDVFSVVARAARAYGVQRVAVTVTGPLELLAVERGDWVLLTHWSGSSATPGVGISGQLFRCESSAPSWAARTVELVLIDFSDVVDNRPAVYDERANWIRYQPGATVPGITFTAGSEFVAVSGVASFPTDVAAGDILVVRSPAAALNRANLRIVDNLGATLELFDADTGLTWFAGANETLISGWTIMRGHTTAPTDDDKPGKYPNGSDHYLRLAGADGLFSSGAAGYKMTGGG